MVDHERIRPPLQTRSEATRSRIGAALAELLSEGSFDDITIGAICERAGASPSSFYARFADKAAALAWLKDDYFAASSRALGERLDVDRWEWLGLDALVHEVMAAYVAFLREHRHVLRALAIENRVRPWTPESLRSREQNLASYQRITALVLSRRDEIHHPDPDFAAVFGLTAAFATSHELILFQEAGMHPLHLSDSQITDALTQTYLSILRAGSSTSRGAPGGGHAP